MGVSLDLIIWQPQAQGIAVFELGAVWGLAPAILFLLGITDPMLHYRSRGSFQKQKEDE